MRRDQTMPPQRWGHDLAHTAALTDLADRRALSRSPGWPPAVATQ